MECFISKNWNIYLDQFPKERMDIYFTEEYVKLYQDEGNEAVCFVCVKEDNLFLFPFLRRRFSFEEKNWFDFETAYGYGGPITKAYDDSFLRDALDNFYSYCKDNCYIAGFVRFHPLLSNHSLYDTIGSILLDRKTVAMDVSITENDIWMQEIHTKNRNVIKKGLRNGLSFIVDTDYRYLNDFIELYKRTMQRLLADEFYFFDNSYYEKFISSIQNSFLGVVLSEEKVVSAALFFYSDIYGHYHLSASDVDRLELCGNNFMLYQAALEMKRRGVRMFHLGGGTTSDENDSLLGFKGRFSQHRYPFFIGKSIFNQSLYERICAVWEKNNEEKAGKYSHFLLKYKY